jgi:hypothetical protein
VASHQSAFLALKRNTTAWLDIPVLATSNEEHEFRFGRIPVGIHRPFLNKIFRFAYWLDHLIIIRVAS